VKQMAAVRTHSAWTSYDTISAEILPERIYNVHTGTKVWVSLLDSSYSESCDVRINEVSRICNSKVCRIA
jgi:hypothetical protein